MSHSPSSELKDKDPASLDLVGDLMNKDVGMVYRKIIETDPLRRSYGYIPLMALSSPAQIGALMAESFCERVISCGNLVVNDGNTLLSDGHVEKATVLRMNRKFMEFMRANYNAVSRQMFGASVVDMHETE